MAGHSESVVGMKPRLWRWGASAVLALAFSLALLAASAGPASGATFAAEPVGNFDAPVHVDNAPGESRLLFVVEQPGRVQVLRDERPLEQPFLDISNIVRAPPDPGAGREEGLLSIAFAPDYRQSRRFYVYFTNRNGDNEVDEFRRAQGDRLRANPASRRRVILIPHPAELNHNGGQLQFGPGGLLYFATGDGGVGGTQFGEPARHLDNLLGKVIRIDPLPQDGMAYGIPPTNPYVGRDGLDEIYAYGLRNPYRFSFDQGRIAIGDVGAGTWEEANILDVDDVAGVNFGWPEWEGPRHIDPTRPGPDPPTFPIHAYPHSPGNNCAITGGYVVRDPGLPALQGRYLYADFCNGALRSLRPRVEAQVAEGDAPIGLASSLPSSFGEGAGSQIYFTELGGGVFRLEQTSP